MVQPPWQKIYMELVVRFFIFYITSWYFSQNKKQIILLQSTYDYTSDRIICFWKIRSINIFIVKPPWPKDYAELVAGFFIFCITSWCISQNKKQIILLESSYDSPSDGTICFKEIRAINIFMVKQPWSKVYTELVAGFFIFCITSWCISQNKKQIILIESAYDSPSDGIICF